MQICMRTLTLVAIVATITFDGQICWAQAKQPVPATVAEAKKNLDLATLPLVKGTEAPNRRNMAGLSCEAPGATKAVFEFYRKVLTDKKWKEAPNAYVSEQSASATFSRDGYTVSLTVFPSKEGFANVMLMQHGNVELAKLPAPPGAKTLYGGPVSLMLITDATLEATSKAVQKLLLEKGWQPYGTAGDSAWYKQNAVRLQANVSTAPAQGGKTVISYSTELMSVDLPAPANTIGLQYSDQVSQLFFDTDAKPAEVVEFYQKTLGKTGWEATTTSLIKIDFKEIMIFRNAPKDMITMEINDVDGKTRVLVRHITAAEVAEQERRFKEEQAKKKKAEGK